ncbi:MAG TPA: tetratricopeptide repeat protein [Phycisphaerae bacterium]|jgi:tetratricopeptide (TPR) repeat protein
MIRVLLSSLILFLPAGWSALPAHGQEPPPPPTTVAEDLDRALDLLHQAEQDEDNRARYLAEANDLVAAVQQREPNNVKADFYLARVLVLAGRSKDALRSVERYAKTRQGANDWEAFKILADLQVQGTYWTLARGNYQKAAELNPREPDLYLGMATCSLQLGKFEDALKQLETAVNMGTQNPKIYDAYAQVLLRDNQVDRALGAAESAVKLAQGDVKNRAGSMRALQELDARYATLEATLTLAVRKHPQTLRLWQRGLEIIDERLELNGRVATQRKLAFVNQGIQATQPNVPIELYLKKAQLSIEARRREDAESALDEADKIDPTNPLAKQLRDSLPAATGEPAPRAGQ